MNTIPQSIIGNIRKLQGTYSDPVSYSLPLSDTTIHLNPLIEKSIVLKFLGEIYCIQCERRINKTFQQGYCYPCYQKLLACNLCIIHPERCSYPEITCPNDWAHEHCSQPHIVYIANSSQLKVGITRATNVPVRWIDQGAVQAVPFVSVSNRRDAGKLEVFIKQFLKDKTNWRQMLSQPNFEHDVLTKKNELKEVISDYIHHHNTEYPETPMHFLEDGVTTINYPIGSLPTKLSSLDLQKSPINATLLGIKGQYLIFDAGVINMRKYGGYRIEFSHQ